MQTQIPFAKAFSLASAPPDARESNLFLVFIFFYSFGFTSPPERSAQEINASFAYLLKGNENAGLAAKKNCNRKSCFK